MYRNILFQQFLGESGGPASFFVVDPLLKACKPALAMLCKGPQKKTDLGFQDY